jgi:outer membrane protein assembly factor BamB
MLAKQRMKRLLFRLSIVFFSFLAGNGFAGNWGHFQHDNAHTGRTDDLVDPSNLAFAWSAENYARALIADDTLYARVLAGESTIVTAFSLNDGQVKWSYFGENIYFAAVQLAGDFIVLDGFDSGGVFHDTLSVLDRETGEFLYKLVLPFDDALAEPTLARDPQTGDVIAICNGGSYGKMVAFRLDKIRGHHLWKKVGDFGSNSIPTMIEDSVVMFGGGSGIALDRATGAHNVFFVDFAGNSNGGAPAVYNSQRKDFYVKLDYLVLGESRVMAFHYNSHDSIEPLWTRITSLSQIGGTVAIGPEGNLYSVGSNELAIIDPNDGSTIQSVPFLFANGCNAVLTRGVVWVHSTTQTYAYDSHTLELLGVLDVGPGLYSGFNSLGAFVSDTVALNTIICTPVCTGGVSVYRSQSLLGIR